MKLKVDDKVRVKSVEEIKKLQVGFGFINGCYFQDDMFEFCDKEFFIEEKINNLAVIKTNLQNQLIKNIMPKNNKTINVLSEVLECLCDYDCKTNFMKVETESGKSMLEIMEDIEDLVEGENLADIESNIIH